MGLLKFLAEGSEILKDRKSLVENVQRHAQLEVGQTYTNKNGSDYKVLSGSGDTWIMRQPKSGWTFTAHVITMYDDGQIEWDYSTDGTFDKVDEGKLADRVRKNDLDYDEETDSVFAKDDDKDIMVQFQDRENDTYFISGKDGKPSGEKHPRVSSQTWGRVWNKGNVKHFRGPKYVVRKDVAKYLDDIENESLNEEVEYLSGTDLMKKVNSKLLRNEIDSDKVSVLHNGKVWWTESRGLSNRAFNILIKEMKRLYPDWVHLTELKNESYDLLSGTHVEQYRNYNKAKARAKELGLKEAEYGDAYGVSYCFWNKSGDRNEDEEVIAYYKFKNGKPVPLSDDEAERIARRIDSEFDDLDESLENMTIEDMFKAVGVKRVFDKNAHFTKEAESKYNEVAKKFFGGNLDKLDKLCDEEDCFNEALDYSEKDALKSSVMKWLLDSDKAQAMHDVYFADEEGNGEKEIISTLASDYISDKKIRKAKDKTYRTFEKDSKFGLRDKDTNKLVKSSDDSKTAWEDSLEEIDDATLNDVKEAIRKAINEFGYYNFNEGLKKVSKKLGETKNFSANIPQKNNLKRALDRFDKNGNLAKQGAWKIAKGGYDKAFEVYYNEMPIITAEVGPSGNTEIKISKADYDGNNTKDIADFICSVYNHCSLKEDYDFSGFMKEIRKELPEKDIDHHATDLYVRVSPKSTEIIKKYGIDKGALLSTFIDNIDHVKWYEVPFIYNESCKPKKRKKKLEEAKAYGTPFKAYITNLGKYNEGELVGKWVPFPVSKEYFDDVLKEIGINDKYEEWFVTDYDSEIDGLSKMLDEYTSFAELNRIAEKLNEYGTEELSNVMEVASDIDDAMEGIDDGRYQYYPGIFNDTDLGQNWIDEVGFEGISNPENYFDYESFGRDLRLEYSPQDEDDPETAEEFYCGDENASDEDIGYEYVESIGGVDQLGKDTIENYFDVEKLGRDLSFDGYTYTSDGCVYSG